MADLWLRNDGLAEGGDELAEQSPSARPRQAASAQRGESSNSSTSGSSSKIMQQDHKEMRKQVWLGRALVGARRPFEADKAFEALEGEFNAAP